MKVTKLFVDEIFFADKRREQLSKFGEMAEASQPDAPALPDLLDAISPLVRHCPEKLVCDVREDAVIAIGEEEHDAEVESRFGVQGFCRIWFMGGGVWYCACPLPSPDGFTEQKQQK